MIWRNLGMLNYVDFYCYEMQQQHVQQRVLLIHRMKLDQIDEAVWKWRMMMMRKKNHWVGVMDV